MPIPFGIDSTSEVFQRVMEQLFAGLSCEIVVDNIIVRAKSIEEHDANLKEVLNRAGHLKLNPSKCRFRLPERDKLCWTCILRQRSQVRSCQSQRNFRNASTRKLDLITEISPHCHISLQMRQPLHSTL